jgi:hypothetical protein
MTVAQLIKYLQSCPREALVVTGAPDHAYRKASVNSCLAEKSAGGGWLFEFYEGEGLYLKDSEIIDVVVID